MPNNVSIKKLLPLAIIAVSLLWVLVLYLTKPQPKAIPLQEQVWSVTAQTVELGTHTPNLQIYGAVESPRDTTMKAGIEADVTERLVDEGNIVKKGQLLIKLDNRDVQLELQQKEADVQELEAQIKAENVRYNADVKSLEHDKELVSLKQRDVNRRETLFKKQLGSEAELDQAKEELAQQKLTLTNRQREIDDHENRLAQLEAKLANAKALVAQAKIELDRSEIRAPFNGRISKISVSVGNRVKTGDTLIELYDDQALEVRSQIPLQYVETIRKAVQQHKRLLANAIVDGYEVRLELDRLSSTVGSGRSGLDIFLDVTKNGSKIEIGKTLNIILQLLPEDNVITLPNQAFYGLNQIYLIKKQRLHSLTVDLVGNIYSHTQQRLLVVRSPQLKNGDVVMTTQLPNAMDGLKVEIKRAK